MIVRHLHTIRELLTVLEQPTAEMQALRVLLTHDGRFPCRRTFERRLTALPDTLRAQISCLGRLWPGQRPFPPYRLIVWNSLRLRHRMRKPPST